MIAIEYEQVSKQFQTNAKPSVNRVSARIDEGEFITILGSSGCGKTTLLKMTNRILDPSEGRILLFGEDISTVDPVTVRRRMGYVIQQIGLFPHMTVEENIAVIPKLMKQDKGQVLNRTRGRCLTGQGSLCPWWNLTLILTQSVTHQNYQEDSSRGSGLPGP